MASVLGRAWGWVRSWGNSVPAENTPTLTPESQTQPGRGGWGQRVWSPWIWGGWRGQSAQCPGGAAEEFWEAQEKLQPMGSPGKQAEAASQQSGWWSRYVSTLYLWPRKTEPGGLRRRRGEAWEQDIDGDFSDYGTPPPSPPPSSQLTSPFRLFAHSLTVETLPEHYDICFNFLRHLFDLFVVAFLWTVSPPAKLILEVLGLQGALRLWVHGMAMFLVSTVGMAGLLWLIQEYLPEFALIYGIVQALVISVSVRQSVILGVEEDKEETDMEAKKPDEVRDSKKPKDELRT
ncbi:uncharacterized protein C6orf47 homolog [Odontesthes bonariensis]|uniref:uncharacterized protein C6orf47 homolog n=1 Tax=Odontesthes bonariensis TaxID=219752 RepID=UPI003F589025